MNDASKGELGMTDDHAVNRIHQILDDHGKKLSAIQDTLQRIAVQDEQIRALQDDIKEQDKKLAEIHGPNGCLAEISRFQASCPRHQIKFLWMTVIPMGMTQIGILLAAMKLVTGM